MRFDECDQDYSVLVDEQFDSDVLDQNTWLPYYLPQWAGREAARARYRVGDGRLDLFIDPAQPRWLPGFEGDLRVSSLQTGCYAGPLGSSIGQHRSNPALRVVEEQPAQWLVAPRFAAIDLRARWTPVPDQMVALWMIGIEDEPHRSAEVCVCEIFGDEADATTARVGVGVHPFDDPTITDDFEKIVADIDVSEWHDYSAVWTRADVTFYIDREPVKVVAQSPQYPMQLMLSIFDFASPSPDRPSAPFQIDRLRVLQDNRTDALLPPVAPSGTSRSSERP